MLGWNGAAAQACNVKPMVALALVKEHADLCRGGCWVQWRQALLPPRQKRLSRRQVPQPGWRQLSAEG